MKWAVFGESRQARRLGPRQRAAKGPAALTQGRGDQLIGTLGQMRARKADQHTALGHPLFQLRLPYFAKTPDIRQHQNRHGPLQ